MIKTFPSNKINDTKNALFFLSRALTHHSFTFNLQFLYDLKHKVLFLTKVPNFPVAFPYVLFHSITDMQSDKTTTHIRQKTVYDNNIALNTETLLFLIFTEHLRTTVSDG